ncbi:MAG: hypothetical protein RMJ53_00600 [Chitinophagales bacterium]|nr:hypothetical protein [Chitinophagales bacterium]MDW8272710.1 hypothetical protein [Chitinophagales bacterium]
MKSHFNHLSIVISLSLSIYTAQGQIEKNTWITGGGLMLNYNGTKDLMLQKSRQIDLGLSVMCARAVRRNLTIGFTPSYEFSDIHYAPSHSITFPQIRQSHELVLAANVRPYFLKKRFGFFIDASLGPLWGRSFIKESNPNLPLLERKAYQNLFGAAIGASPGLIYLINRKWALELQYRLLAYQYRFIPSDKNWQKGNHEHKFSIGSGLNHLFLSVKYFVLPDKKENKTL